MKANKVSLQGIAEYNPKTHDYLVRVGSLLFPFKTMNEVLSYFKRLTRRKVVEWKGQVKEGSRK